jgi:hypothetical protein
MFMMDLNGEYSLWIRFFSGVWTQNLTLEPLYQSCFVLDILCVCVCVCVCVRVC